MALSVSASNVSLFFDFQQFVANTDAQHADSLRHRDSCTRRRLPAFAVADRSCISFPDSLVEAAFDTTMIRSLLIAMSMRTSLWRCGCRHAPVVQPKYWLSSPS